MFSLCCAFLLVGWGKAARLVNGTPEGKLQPWPVGYHAWPTRWQVDLDYGGNIPHPPPWIPAAGSAPGVPPWLPRTDESAAGGPPLGPSNEIEFLRQQLAAQAEEIRALRDRIQQTPRLAAKELEPSESDDDRDATSTSTTTSSPTAARLRSPGSAPILDPTLPNSACWDARSFDVQWNSSETYRRLEQVDRGHHSSVFRGMNALTGNACAIKILRTRSEYRVKREIRILQELHDCASCLPLLDAVTDRASGNVSLIFDFMEFAEPRALQRTLTDYDVRHIAYQVLKALDFSHAKGIMHRDVKPRNVLVARDKKKVRLVDWGLAEYYRVSHESYSFRVGTSHYRSPELLLHRRSYDYSTDMWSYGTMLADMVFDRQPFFDGPSELDSIIRVLGTESFQQFLHKYNLTKPTEVTIFNVQRKPWSSFITSDNRHLANADAVDLIDKLLVLDPSMRLSAAMALQHRYFDPIRRREALVGQYPTSF